MSSNPNQGQGPNADQEGMRMLVIGTILVLLVFWAISYYRYEVNSILGAIAWAHIKPYAWVARHFPVLESLPVVGVPVFRDAGDALMFLEYGGYAGMTDEQRNLLLAVAGRCAWPLYLPVLIWAGTIGRDFRPDIAYRSAHTLESMIGMQSEHWLTSRVARHVNPLERREVSTAGLLQAALAQEARVQTSDVGAMVPVIAPPPSTDAWQRALRPEEWLVSFGVCRDEDRIAQATARDWKVPDEPLQARDQWAEIDIGSLSELLACQLRSPWTGFEGLRPCHKAIAAAMAHFYDYDIEAGNALLNDLGGIYDAIRATGGKMDAAIRAETGMETRIDKVLKGKPGVNLAAVADKHAWLESAFPAMLAVARKDRGVLPAAAFLWLKSEDRLMWYILDSVGSEAIMVEAAGAMAHYRAEHQMSMPIRRPAVFQAARALLEDYLDITPERIEQRAIKTERGLTPAQRLANVRQDEQIRLAKAET